MLPRHTRGFSFIEAIVSIALLGVILIASSAIVRGVPLMQDARDQQIALTIAQSELDALRALGYAALPASGSFTDPTLSALASSTATMTIATSTSFGFDAKIKRVDVTVSWLARDAARHSVLLTTLVTQIGGL